MAWSIVHSLTLRDPAAVGSRSCGLSRLRRISHGTRLTAAVPLGHGDENDAGITATGTVLRDPGPPGRLGLLRFVCGGLHRRNMRRGLGAGLSRNPEQGVERMGSPWISPVIPAPPHPGAVGASGAFWIGCRVRTAA